MADIEIRVGANQVDAKVRSFVVTTGGDDAPAAFEMFLLSLGSCTAATVAGYCRRNELPAEGLQVLMDITRCPETRMATSIKMQLVPPPEFPAERKPELVKAAETCFVKRHLFTPPQIETTVAD